jgi:ABC-2 type transport system permease protein
VKVFAIVATALRRFTRDRSNIFFVLIFPLAIVLLVGLQFGEQPTPRLGVVAPDDPLAQEFVERLDTDARVDVVRFDDSRSAIAEVEDGGIDAAIVVPDDFDTEIEAGRSVDVGYISSPFGVGPQLQALVDDALARTVAIPTAVAAAVERGADPEQASLVADEQAAITELVSVETTTTGDELFPEDLGGFDVGAPSQLVLFMFLTGLTGSAAMIQSRQLGITTRMMSTPTSLRTVIAGEAAARFAIAVTQGIYIMVATVVLFGVNWGDLVASATILAVFGSVGAASAMLAGSVFKNDQQAGGVSVVVALGLAALGGCMLPVELFSDTMLAIARAIPHYWALDAFADVVRHDAGVTDIVPQLGVLAAFTLVIGSVAVWRLRATLTHR